MTRAWGGKPRVEKLAFSRSRRPIGGRWAPARPLAKWRAGETHVRPDRAPAHRSAWANLPRATSPYRVEPLIRADRVDDRRGVGRDRQAVDPLVPRVARREDRAARERRLWRCGGGKSERGHDDDGGKAFHRLQNGRKLGWCPARPCRSG